LAIAPTELSKVQSRSLFKKGMQFLEDHDCGDIVRVGLDSKSWRRVARHMFDHLYEKGIADFKCGKSAFRRLPEDAGAATEIIEGAVERGMPVAVELMRAWNHYTVVVSVDREDWTLFDSHGYKRLKKKSLGLLDPARVMSSAHMRYSLFLAFRSEPQNRLGRVRH
jgi:hypothetical protein